MHASQGRVFWVQNLLILVIGHIYIYGSIDKKKEEKKKDLVNINLDFIYLMNCLKLNHYVITRVNELNCL